MGEIALKSFLKSGLKKLLNIEWIFIFKLHFWEGNDRLNDYKDIKHRS